MLTKEEIEDASFGRGWPSRFLALKKMALQSLEARKLVRDLKSMLEIIDPYREIYEGSIKNAIEKADRWLEK